MNLKSISTISVFSHSLRCQTCGFETDYEDEFTNHMAVTHPFETSNGFLKCNINTCNYITENIEDFDQHNAKEHYFCNKCRFRYVK